MFVKAFHTSFTNDCAHNRVTLRILENWTECRNCKVTHFCKRLHNCLTILILANPRRRACFRYDGKVYSIDLRGSTSLQLQKVPCSRKRSANGTAISEFAPGLFLLLMFGLFPVVDAVCIGVDYASARYLNELQLREAQKLPRSKAIDTNGSVIKTIPLQWRKTLLGGLANTDEPPITKIEYRPVPWQPVGSNQTENFWFVNISTTVSFRPPLAILFFKGVPGLGSPITFSVVGRRPVENNRFLNE